MKIAREPSAQIQRTAGRNKKAISGSGSLSHIGGVSQQPRGPDLPVYRTTSSLDLPFSSYTETMVYSLVIRRSILSASTARGAVRPLSTTQFLRQGGGDKPTPFADSPAPPRLPKEEQEIFEQLQKRSTGAFSTPQVNQSPQAEIQADGKGGELHPDAPKGLQPDFEGEKNPKTGEVGGPKNEPLRWGAAGDWSYGGRVTDF